MSTWWQRVLAALALVLLGGLGITAAAPQSYASDLDFFVGYNGEVDQSHIAHYRACGRFWPSNGQFETFQLSPTDYVATIRFWLEEDEHQHLLCMKRNFNATYLEIDFRINGFDVPAAWDGYSVVATNLPGAMHDVAASDSSEQATPAITNVAVGQLKFGYHYYATLRWNAQLRPADGRPEVSVQWVPSFWADNPVESPLEWGACESAKKVIPPPSTPPWCIFPRSRVYLSGGYYDGRLPLDGLRVFLFSSGRATNSHHSLGVTIVRNPGNGASWLVGRDGHRNWIPTGGDYLCLTQQGHRVLNLPQGSIDLIPDHVGTHAKCTPQDKVGPTSGPATPPPSSAITSGPSTKPPASSSSGYGLAWLQGTTLLKFAGPGLSEVGSVDGIGRPDWAGVGDYDKDGKEDLFWYHGGSDSSIYVLRSTGSSFSSIGPVRGPGVGKPTWAGAGDFNGDGYRDEIAWLEGSTLFLLSGKTLSTVSATPNIGAPDWAGVGDYDGDGKDDLFWYHGGADGSIYVLKSEGQRFSSVGRIRGPDVGAPDWAGVGDFDGDGRRNDIAWHQGDRLFTFCGPKLGNCGDASGIATPTWAGVVNWGGNDQRDDLLWFHGGGDGSFYKLEMSPGTNNFRSTGRLRGSGIGTPLVALGGVF